jgi:hypothetical protein
MQQHFLLFTCETIIIFISLISFSFDLDIYFHVVGKLDLTILVSDFRIVQVIKISYVQCLLSTKDVCMFLKRFPMGMITSF